MENLDFNILISDLTQLALDARTDLVITEHEIENRFDKALEYLTPESEGEYITDTITF